MVTRIAEAQHIMLELTIETTDQDTILAIEKSIRGTRDRIVPIYRDGNVIRIPIYARKDEPIAKEQVERTIKNLCKRTNKTLPDFRWGS